MDTENLEAINTETKSKKKPIITICVVVLVLAGLFFGWIKYKEIEYQNNYDTAVYSMLDNCTTGEKLLNELLDVWHDSIWQVEDDETKAWTKDANGKFYDDFNDALSSYYASENFTEKYNEIVSNDSEIRAVVRKLQNPPSKFETAYEKLIDYYSWYSEFIGLAENQSNMSYNDVSEQFNDLEDDFKGLFSKVQMFTSY